MTLAVIKLSETENASDYFLQCFVVSVVVAHTMPFIEYLFYSKRKSPAL